MPVTAIQTRAAEFREIFEQRAWVADGAMGTMLYAKGAFINRCFDELNLSLPALVRDVHQEYLRAGAELIETNTFGANRKRLATFGFADKVRLINRAGVRIAREAARDQAFVAGAVGPLGVRVEPLGSTSLDEARSIFREQIDALVEAGVDCLMLETFRDMNEIRAAVEAAREVAGPELVIVAHLSIEDDGRLQDGTSIEDFTRALDTLPVDAIGLNCSGPYALFQAFEKMAAYTQKPLSALPNAGRGTNICSPEYMASYAARFLQTGARIVGGCCGTTPEHITAIGNVIRDLQPARGSAFISEPETKPQPMERVPVAAKSRLGAKLAAKKFVSLVEMLPPIGLDAHELIAGAKRYKEAGFDGIIVPDRTRAGARLSAQITCQLIEQDAGIETVLQIASRDRSIPRIQSELLGAYKIGIRHLISNDTVPESDVDSVVLTTIADHLNRGLNLGGNQIGTQTALLLGVEVNPSACNMEEELRRFEAKVKAGAEFAVTQPLFDVDLLVAFLARTRDFAIPVIAGIWPLTSFRNAEFLVNELRVPISEVYMDRMRQTDSAEAAEAEGLAIAREIVERVRPIAAGIQVSTPMGRYQTAIDVALD